MTYTTIDELPSQVTASLDEDDAKICMDTYNSLDPRTKEEVKAAKKYAWHACANLPSSFSFRIKASMDAVDKDREIIDLNSIKEHIDSYIDYGGNIQWEHGDYQVGVAWDWEPINYHGMDGIEVYGNIFGGDSVYDEMRKAFTQGKNSLSVAGEADKGKYQCDDRGCYIRRDVKQLMEISLCAVPANKHCTLSWYNESAKLTKSDNGIYSPPMSIEEYEIHKSYHECPHLALRRSLRKAGFDAHATEAGVIVSMTEDSFRKSFRWFDENNLSAVWLGDAVLLNDRRYLAELSFKKGVSEGWMDRDGKVNWKITKSDLGLLKERDVLVKGDDGIYYLKMDGDDLPSIVCNTF